MKNTYEISVLQIADLDIDLGVVAKWIKIQGPGNYKIKVTKDDESETKKD